MSSGASGMSGNLTKRALSGMAAELFRSGPVLFRYMQMGRPYICPFHELVSLVPGGSRVLDIGCGGGLFLAYLARLGIISSGVGIDPSRVAIAAAENMRANNGLGNQLDFVAGPFPYGSRECFDLVSLIDVLHHVPRPQQRDFIRAAVRHVKRGGFLLIKEMRPRPVHGALLNGLHDMILAGEVPRYVDERVMRSWAAEEGLQPRHFKHDRLMWYYHHTHLLQA